MANLKTVLQAMTAGVILISGAGCKKEQNKKVEERVTRVTVQKLEKRTLRKRIPVQGTVSPVESAMISAKISGTVEQLRITGGDRLKAGDVLFAIDRQVLKNQVVVKEDEIKVKEAALQSAKFAMKMAEITLRQAKLDYDRALTLRNSNAISQASFESAETEFQKAQMEVQAAEATVINAEAQLRQARSNLDIAKKNLDDSVIRAPFDCVVFDTYVEQSEYVSTGQNIVKLENPDNFEIVCYISAVYYNEVTEGKTAVEFIDNQGKKQRCCVTYKAPAIDPESRTFKLKAKLPRGSRVVSGMLCELNIILAEKKAYSLPADSLLLRANDRYIAFTVNGENRAESVQIRRGITDGQYCEVLNAKDILDKLFVVTGQTFINNGALLKIINQ